MEQQELDMMVREFARENNVPIEKCRPIPKNKLVSGTTYPGECRNASEAEWTGDHFVYRRYKWGNVFLEDINHYEDDNGYDVFVPIEIIKQ
jgi:hypothetical protein